MSLLSDLILALGKPFGLVFHSLRRINFILIDNCLFEELFTICLGYDLLWRIMCVGLSPIECLDFDPDRAGWGSLAIWWLLPEIFQAASSTRRIILRVLLTLVNGYSEVHADLVLFVSRKLDVIFGELLQDLFLEPYREGVQPQHPINFVLYKH